MANKKPNSSEIGYVLSISLGVVLIIIGLFTHLFFDEGLEIALFASLFVVIGVLGMVNEMSKKKQ